MGTRLFVGGLRWETSDAALRGAFERFGAVREAAVVLDRETGRSRGFGFVTFEREADCAAAHKAMDGAMLEGRPLRVSVAEDRPPPRGDARGPGAGGPPRAFGPRDGGPAGGRYDRTMPAAGSGNSFRDGPSGSGSHRDGPHRDGPHRDGPHRDGPYRDGPSGDGGPPRGGFGRPASGFGGGDRGQPVPSSDYVGSRGASRGGWDLAPPDDFGGGKRDRSRRDRSRPERRGHAEDDGGRAHQGRRNRNDVEDFEDFDE